MFVCAKGVQKALYENRLAPLKNAKVTLLIRLGRTFDKGLFSAFRKTTSITAIQNTQTNI